MCVPKDLTYCLTDILSFYIQTSHRKGFPFWRRYKKNSQKINTLIPPHKKVSNLRKDKSIILLPIPGYMIQITSFGHILFDDLMSQHSFESLHFLSKILSKVFNILLNKKLIYQILNILIETILIKYVRHNSVSNNNPIDIIMFLLFFLLFLSSLLRIFFLEW